MKHHGPVHHDGLAQEDRVVARRQDHPGEPRRDREVTHPDENPHRRPVAILDDDLLRRQRRPADIFLAVPPLHETGARTLRPGSRPIRSHRRRSSDRSGRSPSPSWPLRHLRPSTIPIARYGPSGRQYRGANRRCGWPQRRPRPSVNGVASGRRVPERPRNSTEDLT